MSNDKTPRFRYRLGLNQPAGSPTVRRITEMAEAIRRETDGEFLVEVFPESRLGPDPKMFADLCSGALEFFMAGATLGDVAPTSALPLLPFAFWDSKAVFAALDGALGDQIRGELAKNGIHAFRHCLQNGFHHLTTSTRPIHTAADLAGLKIRSPGGAIARDFFEAFGAETGYVPFSQMYDALKARNFDGQSDPLGVVLSLKLYEVQTYLSLTAHWWSGFTLLAAAGAELVLVSRTPSELDSVAGEIESSGGKARPLPFDVTRSDAVRDAFAGLERLDILVNNAGLNRPQPFLDVDEPTLDLLLGLNVRAAFVVAQAAARLMVAKGGGVIINVSSQMGHVGSDLNRSVHVMTKHAVDGLTKAMAVELAPKRVRVVSIAPTFVTTPLTTPFF